MRMKTTPPNRIVKTGNSHNVCAPENRIKKQLKFVFNSSFKKVFTDAFLCQKNTIGLEISFFSKSEQTLKGLNLDEVHQRTE